MANKSWKHQKTRHLGVFILIFFNVKTINGDARKMFYR